VYRRKNGGRVRQESFRGVERTEKIIKQKEGCISRGERAIMANRPNLILRGYCWGKRELLINKEEVGNKERDKVKIHFVCWEGVKSWKDINMIGNSVGWERFCLNRKRTWKKRKNGEEVVLELQKKEDSGVGACL